MPTPITRVVFTKAGGPEVVQVVEAQLPDPGKDEVQVQVIYAGFGGSDINMRGGTYPMQTGFPLNPGYSFVGRVSANGSGSQKFNVGDIVCALTKYDSQATYTNFAEKYLVQLPADLDPGAACALVLDWTTAYGMVYRSAEVKAGDKVFIHGLSGAVGNALLRLCLLEGATVYGTASPSKHKELKQQGATEVYDYHNKDWMDAILKLGGVNAAFDPLGFESYDESFAVLDRSRSILVGYGANAQTIGDKKGSQLAGFMSMGKLYAKNLCFTHRSATFFYVDKDQKTYIPDLLALFELARTGKVEVPIKKVFTLQEVPAIHQEWTKLDGIGSCLVKVEQ